MSVRICGSCHTLVTLEQESLTICPHCEDPLDPDAGAILTRFIASGVIEFNRKGGVTQKQAQAAAATILERLDLHHREGRCPDCP